MRTKALLLASLSAALFFSACGDEDEANADDSLFECADGRDGWEQCVDDAVQWCHATADPHFHIGRVCADDGLICTAKDRVGYCADPDERCEDGTPGMCGDRQAINCIDGMVAYRRCGIGTQCAVNAEGLAACELL